MYVSFGIEHFRGFKSLKLNDLSQINLIAGRNNTGKTALLEAILFHARQNTKNFLYYNLLLRTEADTSAQRLRRQNLPDWDTLFYQFDTTHPIEFEGGYVNRPQATNGTPAQWRVQIGAINNLAQLDEGILGKLRNEANRFANGTNDYGVPALISDLQVVIVENDIEGSPDYIAQYADDLFGIVGSSLNPVVIPSVLLTANTRSRAEIDARLFTKLDVAGHLDMLMAALQILEPRLKSLRLIHPADMPVIVGDLGLEKPVALSMMGEGVRRITSLILSMGNIEHGMLLVDEIENGLHYDSLPQLWQIIGEAARLFDVQVFATTHSFECIQAAHSIFNQQAEYNFRLHRLDRSRKSGDIRAVTYSQESLDAALDLNFEVR